MLPCRIHKPVFITGCGRSGTTILGKTLSHHPSFFYLNEPRHIWNRAYPETDISSRNASENKGNVCLNKSICTYRKNRILKGLFYSELVESGKKRLLEKLPVNNFRLDFINSIFPDALFIHIIRNGFEVARSIEKYCQAGKRWWGAGDYKWKELARYAEQFDNYKALPGICRTDYEKGLLEWRLSVDAAVSFFNASSENRSLVVKYEDLLANTSAVLDKIERFTGVSRSDEVHTYGAEQISRKSSEIVSEDITQIERRIAGSLMKQLGYLQ